MPKIVGVQVSDDLSARRFETRVAGGGRAALLRVAEHPDPTLGKRPQLRGRRVAARVVADDQLEIPVCLRQHGADRIPDHRLPVAHRHDHGDQRPRPGEAPPVRSGRNSRIVRRAWAR
jgi:hypothetical protein